MKLSIITINLNNKSGFQKTAESVVSQLFNDFEWIVIDGGSTDGSTEVINRYVDKMTYWVSEPDTGIYNAMNKGIKVAKGEYCLFLNSGDWIADKNVISDFVSSNPTYSVITGNTYLWSNNSIIETRLAPVDEELTINHMIDDVLIHQSTFIKRDLLERYGMYDENLRFVSDWKFFIQTLFMNNESYSNWDRVVSYFDLTNNHSDATIERDELINRSMYRLFSQYYTDKMKMAELQCELAKYISLRDSRVGILVRLAEKIRRMGK